jgi:hypothetical protein
MVDEMKGVVASVELLVSLSIFATVFTIFIANTVSAQIAASQRYISISNETAQEALLQSEIFVLERAGLNPGSFQSVLETNFLNVSLTQVNLNGNQELPYSLKGITRLVAIDGKIYVLNVDG